MKPVPEPTFKCSLCRDVGWVSVPPGKTFTTIGNPEENRPGVRLVASDTARAAVRCAVCNPEPKPKERGSNFA